MPTIVSCPKCREQVTLPPEPYSGLICPHCQAEFSMQPMLRQPMQTPYSSLRQELARDVRQGLNTSSRSAGPVTLAEVGDAVIALPQRRSPSFLAMACHLIGLVGGGAMGLAVGYCLLTWLGGAHFNVLELPLPWLPVMAQSPNGQPSNTAQPTGPADPPSGHVIAAQNSSAATPPSLATARVDVAAASAGNGPQLAPASHAIHSVNLPSDPASQSTSRAAGEEIVSRSETRSVTSRESYTVKELSAAAAAARDAVACAACKSSGFVIRSVSGRESPPQRCPMCRGTGGAGVTAEVYGKLCQLADTVTHFDPSDETALPAKQELESLFRKAADRPEKQAALGRHAAQRIVAPPQLGNRGVLLVGTIDRKEQLRRCHLTRLVLLGSPVPALVVSYGPIPFQPGERVIVAGSLDAGDPSLLLGDYAGPREPLVRGGMPLRLEE
jgi:hypothetical protein